MSDKESIDAVFEEGAILPQNKDLSQSYKAIDGISYKRDGSVGGLDGEECDWSDPGYDAVREDLVGILTMNPVAFTSWYGRRSDAVDSQIKIYRRICDVPDLGVAEGAPTMGDTINVFKDYLVALERARDHLDKIKEAYDLVDSEHKSKDYYFKDSVE